VTIARIAGLESAILGALDPGLANVCKLRDSAREMALVLSKYGFLDLTFEASAHLLSTDDGLSRATLRELNFMRAESGTEEDRFCLESLIEGIEESRCWFRLFLFGEPAMDAIKRIFEQYKGCAPPTSRSAPTESTMFRLEKAISRLADSVDHRLPMTFRVQDACLTNSNAIWLPTHCYW
jgi:hypothetical protein